MNKNELFTIVVIAIILVLSIGSLYLFINKRTYELNLPKLENLESILIKQNLNEKIITDNEKMKEVLDILVKERRITKEESIQDYPININDEIKIDFNFIERGTSTIFLYTKNSKYYIEQPYNGIYQIDKEEYNYIEKLIKI